jgi:hypothetical protein
MWWREERGGKGEERTVSGQVTGLIYLRYTSFKMNPVPFPLFTLAFFDMLRISSLAFPWLVHLGVLTILHIVYEQFRSTLHIEHYSHVYSSAPFLSTPSESPSWRVSMRRRIGDEGERGRRRLTETYHNLPMLPAIQESPLHHIHPP